MIRKPKTLVMNIRYACSIESANVPDVLARLGGGEGHAHLVSTDVERGDLAAYISRHEDAAASPAEPRGRRLKKAPPADRPSRPGPVAAKRRTREVHAAKAG